MVLAPKERRLVNCLVSSTGLTGSIAEKVLEKIDFLLNDLEHNSSGGNEDKQNEDI